MRDPNTPTEWQECVNAARFMLTPKWPTPWLPIDTAPRDSGLWVMLLWGNHHDIAYWDKHAERWHSISGPCTRNPGNQPTHWMPMPPTQEILERYSIDNDARCRELIERAAVMGIYPETAQCP